MTADKKEGNSPVEAVILFLSVSALAVMILVPLADLLYARLFFRGISFASALVSNSVVVLAFVAAAMASREGRHLALSSDRKAAIGLRAVLARFCEAAVTASFLWASLSLMIIGFDPGARIGFLPVRLFAAAIPLGFALMAGYAAFREGKAGRIAAVAGLVVGTFLSGSAFSHCLGQLAGGTPAFIEAWSALSLKVLDLTRFGLLAILVVAGIAGAPLFSVLGGIALVFLGATGRYLELAPSEAYSLLKGSQIGALPLFGVAGFLLAESGAGKRLVAVFREFFGPIPGGEALAAVLVCAFFTTFTGANGVTIVALGGLLVGILVDSGCATPALARGIVTASGAIGLLLPPSAAVIVYGINATFIYGEGSSIDITELFKGCLVPGIILVLAMGAAGIVGAIRNGAKPRKFEGRVAFKALKPAALELATPLVAAALFFSGQAGLTEIAGLTVLYLLIVEGLVKKELDLRSILSAVRKSLPVVGGTLVILAAARGLSFYLIDADIPNIFTEWVKSTATSPFLFLVFLNLALLVVGCMMDIFSAILIAAPLVIPIGASFGLDPIHLGVVFILNLCIGFLTPPVGMSLFLAGYAFDKPLSRIVKDVWPFLLIQLVVLVFVTWLPELTTFLLKH